MLSCVNSAVIHGLDAIAIRIEIDVSRGMPIFQIVGQADSSVAEAKERIRAGIRNCGIDFPMGRITVNMAPASVRKHGSGLDLPLAVGIAACAGAVFDGKFDAWGLIGELSLTGEVKGVQGILAMVIALKQEGIRKIIVPRDNVEEASFVPGVEIYGVFDLGEVIHHFNASQPLQHERLRPDMEMLLSGRNYNVDFADVAGQDEAKRVLTIAAAGGHGVLMCGSPATGKTMLAERVPTILPDLSYEEAMEITRIYSIGGQMKKSIMSERPFRHPHHRITVAGLIGGGRYPKPGEVTLAHRGVLFLDEFAEFSREVIDSLRQPMEERCILLNRLGEEYRYPSDFLLVAATNPCPCGYFGDNRKKCRCSATEINRYQRRISGPVRNRIDLHIMLQSSRYRELEEGGRISSSEMRLRVVGARARQAERFEGEEISLNSEIQMRDVKRFLEFEPEAEKMIETAYESFRMNPRTLLKVRRIARTIADLDEHPRIQSEDVAEAISYQKNIFGKSVIETLYK